SARTSSLSCGRENLMSTRLRRSALVLLAVLGLTVPALSAAGAAGQPARSVATSSAAAVSSVAPRTVAQAASTKPATKPTPVQPAYLLDDHVTQDGVNMRACASTSCPIVGTANTNHTLHSWCYLSGQSIFGNPYWDLVYNVTTEIGRAH